MIEEAPRKTPTDTLIAAMEQAEDMDDVIVIFSRKDGKTYGCEDNECTLKDSLWLVEMFKQWLYRSVMPEKD